MSLNTDDFEQGLQRQELRQIPPEWRAEILATTQHASNIHHASFWRAIISTLNSQLSTLLWPSPKAWASLAAIWLLLIVVNASTNDKSIAVARALPRPAPERLMAWREQERLLTELLGTREMPAAEKTKPAAPSPRSERHAEFLII
jgi:hypothetical protein